MGSGFSGKSLNCCHQMSNFEAKCTKIDFGWGSAPDPAEALLCIFPCSPCPPGWNKGDLLLREEKGRKGKMRRGGEEMEERERVGEERGGDPMCRPIFTFF